MKVSVQPVASIPAYVREAAHPVAQRVASPFSHPNSQVALFGFTPAVQRDTGAQELELLESLLKLVTEGVAQHVGHHALIANKALWLCISGFELAKELRQPGVPWEKALGIAGFAVGAADVASSVFNAPGLEDATARVDFFLKQGENVLRGELKLDYADLAKLQGDVPAATQAGLQLVDMLVALKDRLDGAVQSHPPAK